MYLNLVNNPNSPDLKKHIFSNKNKTYRVKILVGNYTFNTINIIQQVSPKHLFRFIPRHDKHRESTPTKFLSSDQTPTPAPVIRVFFIDLELTRRQRLEHHPLPLSRISYIFNIPVVRNKNVRVLYILFLILL